MLLTGGPVVYLTSGSPKSLAGLTATTKLAAQLDRPTNILVQLPFRAQPTIADKIIAGVRDTLPDNLDLPVEAARPSELRPALKKVAESTGGTVALIPTRRHGLSRLLVNNRFERLLHDGPLPVLVLPDGGQIDPVTRVLFPADFSPRSEAGFDQTVAYCRHVGADLHLLHVYGADGLLASETDRERRSAANSPFELLQIDQENLELLRARAEAQGVRTVAATAEGRAHQKILQYAAAEGINLIVMASHGPRNQEDIWRGTSTVRVTLDTKLPVLAFHA